MYTFFYSPCCCKIISLPVFSKVYPRSEIRVLSSLYFKSVGPRDWISSTSYRKIFQLLKIFFWYLFLCLYVIYCSAISGLSDIPGHFIDFLFRKVRSQFSPIMPMPTSPPLPLPTGRVYSIHWVQSILWCMDQTCFHYHTTFIDFF